jgi:hypothetical protein
MARGFGSWPDTNEPCRLSSLGCGAGLQGFWYLQFLAELRLSKIFLAKI